MMNLGDIIPLRSWPASVYVIVTLVLVLAFGGMVTRPSFPKTAPKVHRGFPLLGSLEFFRARSDFMRQGKAQSKTGQFSFHYGPHSVVGVSGKAGKAAFYGNRGLDFNEGFKHLFALGPDIRFLRMTEDEDLIPDFLANLKRFMTKERLKAGLPLLIADTHAALSTMSSAPQGILRPFDEMWRLVYQLTHRTLGTKDIADDPKELARTMAIYMTMDGSSALDVMFPALPTPKKLRKIWAGAQLHQTFSRIVEDRKKTGRREEDVMQALMDQGADNMKISAFIMGSLFAGVLNSGINAAWILCYLARDRTWYARIQEQVDAVITKHRRDDDEQPVDVFQRLTIEEWETEFPLIELGLRDSIRLNMLGVGMRKNLSGKDIPLGETGEVIPNNAFAVYLMDHTHLDENTYPDPMKWDPGRYLPERAEDQKSQHAYLGWGVGLHPCLGMRFAKLEIAITTAMFMAHFDFRLCDKNGSPVDTLPLVDRNGLGIPKPKEDVYIKCTLRV
ncbi:cytochrome P450 [Ilyonectria robusta]|uniref:cytochrome P450 n=1 Tax=Ilyonectria robusta TaxID=1079257 RepID=UPI001E8E4BFE|nr:cytochrome P450 [Ilyonectria robusta]KAH8685239.1 cytochrome P450 [Ilyonectria robusta]